MGRIIPYNYYGKKHVPNHQSDINVGCLNHVKTVLFLMTQGLKPLIRAVPRRKAQGTTDSSTVAGQDLRIFTAWYSGGAMVYNVYIYI